MMNSRQIAAAIDLRVRQLAAQTASDSALIDQMVGYMADLQRLWISTTDVELATLCEEYPGFLRYATLMENLSEALRTGVGVPAHIQQLPRLPDHFKRVMEGLLTDGAALERALQQCNDQAHAGRTNDEVIQSLPRGPRDLDRLYRQWSAGVVQFVTEVRGSDLPEPSQQLMLQAFKDIASRIECLQKIA